MNFRTLTLVILALAVAGLAGLAGLSYALDTATEPESIRLAREAERARIDVERAEVVERLAAAEVDIATADQIQSETAARRVEDWLSWLGCLVPLVLVFMAAMWALGRRGPFASDDD